MGSYSYRPGLYQSRTTGRRYEFDERDPIAKRRAKSDLEHDDAVAQSAQAERQANVPADTRTDAERVSAREGVTHRQQNAPDATQAITNRIAELKARLPFATRTEKAQLARRLVILEQRQAALALKQEALAARRELLESQPVQTVLAEAQQLYDDWRFRGDVSEHVVQGAAIALQTLKDNLDVTQWRETARKLRQAHNTDRQGKIDDLKDQQQALQAQLVTIKADEAPPESVH